MKTFNLLIALLTIVNIGVLVIRWQYLKNSQQNNVQAQATTVSTVEPNIKDGLYLRALIDENKKIAKQTSIKKQAPQLILRFSFRNCDACVRSALEELNQFVKTTGVDDAKAEGTFANERDFVIFKDIFNFNTFPILNLPEDQYQLQLEKDASDPFFFLLFPDGGVRHVFIPMKEDVERTRRYLAIIQEKYFSQK
jgi:hypothetical protein